MSRVANLIKHALMEALLEAKGPSEEHLKRVRDSHVRSAFDAAAQYHKKHVEAKVDANSKEWSNDTFPRESRQKLINKELESGKSDHAIAYRIQSKAAETGSSEKDREVALNHPLSKKHFRMDKKSGFHRFFPPHEIHTHSDYY